MSTVTAGKEVLAWCSKCSLILSHLVESMLDAKTINRVQCKTCLSSHQYKKSSASKTSALKVQVKKSTRSEKTELADQDRWAKHIKNYSQFTTYKISVAAKVGDPIEHPSFGKGIVEAIVSGGRMNVLFQLGTKELVYGKK